MVELDDEMSLRCVASRQVTHDSPAWRVHHGDAILVAQGDERIAPVRRTKGPELEDLKGFRPVRRIDNS